MRFGFPLRTLRSLCPLRYVLVFLFAFPLSAQTPPGVARFELPSSGLEWKELAHPQKYFDATGRRAGVFGKQTGLFEAWIYPIKLLKGFRLEFRQEGMAEPVRGENYLEQIVVRPESTTLVYVHPNFTVRQIIWVPLEEPAIAMFFDVDSAKPLAITAKFVPEFKPMWPASFGGQYSYWMGEEKAFGLTDATSKPTAVIGSPAVGAFTEHMDHALVGGEMLLQLSVSPEQARSMYIPLVMSLSMESAAKAREIFRSVRDRLRPLFEARVKYHQDFLARTLEIETPDAELNRAFMWAKVAIDAGWVCHEKYGCGLVAGYGPAGDYERPGFAWWFGGDALMATWAMLDYGDHEGALQALRFLKARQRTDGKMMHEMTQSVDLIDWFGKFGFAYYHADTTPMYLYSIAEYWRRTGDKNFLEEFWPSAKKAYEYCLSTVDPEDGLMSNTKAGLAAVEVGPLRGKVVKDIYLQGFWLAGLGGMFEMSEAIGDAQLLADVKKRIFPAGNSIEEKWWNPGDLNFAFGVDAEGKRVEMVGIWSAAMLALGAGNSPFIRPAYTGTQILARPDLATDWGMRWISNKDSLYDPVSYNNGSAWPFMSGIVAWAQYAHRQPLAGFATLRSIASLAGIQSAGHMPEHMNGDRNIPGARSVPHQLFSSVGLLLGISRGIFGFSIGIPVPEEHPSKSDVSIGQWLPADWKFARFSRYRTFGGLLSGEIRQEPGRSTARLELVGGRSLYVSVQFPVPYGAKVRRALLNGKPVKHGAPDVIDEEKTWVEFTLEGRTEVTLEYDGGVAILPVAPKPELGDRTTSLKILRVEQPWGNKTCPLQVTLAGLGGWTYALDLVTTLAQIRVEGFTPRKTENGFRLEIPFEGTDYATRQICVAW